MNTFPSRSTSCLFQTTAFDQVTQTNFIFRVCHLLTDTKYKIDLGNLIEYNWQGMWRVWGRIEVCTGCWWGSLRERSHWGDQDVHGRIILRWIFRMLEGGRGDWMELAQDRDRWRALVGTVRDFRVP